MAQGQKKLLIEGWRGLPHSYAMVNQFQILELLKRPEISIAHRDLPYLAPHWKPVGGLFSVEQERQIAAIRMPGEGERFDALYRIGGRIDLRRFAAGGSHGCLHDRRISHDSQGIYV